MKFEQLKYAIEIARAGSLNKAAQRLFVSQPSLSLAINKLEDSINFKIFERTNKGIKLTKAGQEFITSAELILNQLNYLENISKGDVDFSHYTFKISSQPFLFVLAIFLQLHGCYKDKVVRFSYKETDAFNVINDVMENQSEIGVICISNLQERLWMQMLKQKKIEFREISKEYLHIYLGKNNPLYQREIITLNECLSFPLIIYRGEDQNYSSEWNFIELQNISNSISVYDRASFLNTIAITKGFAVGFKLHKIGEYINLLHDINSIPLNTKGLYFKIGWIKKKEYPLTQIGQEFVNLLQQIHR